MPDENEHQTVTRVLAVAHTLNFAHASERLNMSQPALSLAIKGLEDALGALYCCVLREK